MAGEGQRTMGENISLVFQECVKLSIHVVLFQEHHSPSFWIKKTSALQVPPHVREESPLQGLLQSPSGTNLEEGGP